MTDNIGWLRTAFWSKTALDPLRSATLPKKDRTTRIAETRGPNFDQ